MNQLFQLTLLRNFLTPLGEGAGLLRGLLLRGLLLRGEDSGLMGEDLPPLSTLGGLELFPRIFLKTGGSSAVMSGLESLLSTTFGMVSSSLKSLISLGLSIGEVSERKERTGETR